MHFKPHIHASIVISKSCVCFVTFLTPLGIMRYFYIQSTYRAHVYASHLVDPLHPDFSSSSVGLHHQRVTLYPEINSKLFAQQIPNDQTECVKIPKRGLLSPRAMNPFASYIIIYHWLSYYPFSFHITRVHNVRLNKETGCRNSGIIVCGRFVA